MTPGEWKASPPSDRLSRQVRVRLGADRATTETTLSGPAGVRTISSGPIDYRVTTHGLSRWTDPADGLSYVIGSGALGGAAHFVAAADGPADRASTEVKVVPLAPHDVVRASGGDLASHHLGLVSGPWRVVEGPGVEMLVRRSMQRQAEVETLLEETRRVLDWLLDWFGASGDAAPWGAVYTQVLIPRAPWMAMEHPGCVLVSERLLDLRPARRLAVLAHEAAHQWVGNLVSPRNWADVGVFEGLAELLGQLAGAALVGPACDADLARRRALGPLPLPPTDVDLRTLAVTAGLAEVAGPVQHADVLRAVRATIGDRAFWSRVRDLVRLHAGTVAGAADLWAALDVRPRPVSVLRLPRVAHPRRPPWLSGLDVSDPATATISARRAFRAVPPGPARVAQALGAMIDPGTPYSVIAGLAAELVPKNNLREFGLTIFPSV